MMWIYFLALVDMNYLIAINVDNAIEANHTLSYYIPFYRNFSDLPFSFSILTEKQQMTL